MVDSTGRNQGFTGSLDNIKLDSYNTSQFFSVRTLNTDIIRPQSLSLPAVEF
jgi:hypothetical protein